MTHQAYKLSLNADAIIFKLKDEDRERNDGHSFYYVFWMFLVDIFYQSFTEHKNYFYNFFLKIGCLIKVAPKYLPVCLEQLHWKWF